MMYTDEYSIVDTDFIVSAVALDPCEHEDDGKYRIGLILAVGQGGVPVCHTYPTRALRDEAFERLRAMVDLEHADVEDEE